MSREKRYPVCIALNDREEKVAKIYAIRIGASVSQIFRIALSEYVAAHHSKGFEAVILSDIAEPEVPKQ